MTELASSSSSSFNLISGSSSSLPFAFRAPPTLVYLGGAGLNSGVLSNNGGGGKGGGGTVINVNGQLFTPIIPPGGQFASVNNPQPGPNLLLKSFLARAGAWIDSISQLVGGPGSNAQYPTVAQAVADRDPAAPSIGNQNIVIVSSVAETIPPLGNGAGEFEIRLNDGVQWTFPAGINLRNGGAAGDASVRIEGSSINGSSIVIAPAANQTWANVQLGQLGLRQVSLINQGSGLVASAGTVVRTESLSLTLEAGALGFSALGLGSELAQSTFTANSAAGPFLDNQSNSLAVRDATVLHNASMNGTTWFRWVDGTPPSDGLIDGLTVRTLGAGATGIVRVSVVRRVASAPTTQQFSLTWEVTGRANDEGSLTDASLDSLIIRPVVGTLRGVTVKQLSALNDISLNHPFPVNSLALRVTDSDFRFLNSVNGIASAVDSVFLHNDRLTNLQLFVPANLVIRHLAVEQSRFVLDAIIGPQLLTLNNTTITGDALFVGNTFDSLSIDDQSPALTLIFRDNRMTGSAAGNVPLFSCRALVGTLTDEGRKNIGGNVFDWLAATTPAIRLSVNGFIFSDNQINNSAGLPITDYLVSIEGLSNGQSAVNIQFNDNKITLSGVRFDVGGTRSLHVADNHIDGRLIITNAEAVNCQGNSFGQSLEIGDSTRAMINNNTSTLPQQGLDAPLTFLVVNCDGATVNGNVGFNSMRVANCVVATVSANSLVGGLTIDTCQYVSATGNEVSNFALTLINSSDNVVSGNRATISIGSNCLRNAITGNWCASIIFADATSYSASVTGNYIFVGGTIDLANGSVIAARGSSIMSNVLPTGGLLGVNAANDVFQVGAIPLNKFY